MQKKRIIIALAYLVFLLLALEGICRLTLFIPWSSQKLFSDEDLSWRRAWVSRHEPGTDIYYAFDQYDETKGWITRPDLTDMTVFGDRVLNTNSRGLRGKREFTHDRVPGRLRVVILGDSFTFGDEVSDHETYAHALQGMLPQAEVINMGVHGYGHDQMLIHLREEGVKYRPDIVVVGFISFDMERNVLGFRDYAKPRFELEGDGLRLTNAPVPAPDEILEHDWVRPRIVDLWSIVKLRYRVMTGAYQRQRDEVTRRILDEIVGTAVGIGARPVFIYLPAEQELADSHQPAAAEIFLLDWGRSNSAAVCATARPHFQEQMRRGVTFRTEGHWGPAGHRAVAEAIHHVLHAEALLGSAQLEAR